MTCEDAPCCGCCGYQTMMADAQYQDEMAMEGWDYGDDEGAYDDEDLND